MWIKFKLSLEMRKFRYLLRKSLRVHSIDLRSYPAFPAADLIEVFLPIAEQHNIRFGRSEMTFPVNPLVDQLVGGNISTRLVLYRNIVSVRLLNGFMWLISRSGHLYGFSLATDERITDYMFPDVEKLRVPRWWGRFCVWILRI